MTISGHPWLKLLVSIVAAIVVGIITDSSGWGIGTFIILMFIFIWVASWIFGGDIKGKVELTDELEELISKLETIGNIKNGLPLNARGWCNSLGLFVQLKEMAALSRLQAGEKRISHIDAWMDIVESGIDWKIKKYTPGDWELLVDPTLEIALWLSSHEGLPEEYSDSLKSAIKVFCDGGQLDLPAR
ncbi:MAG: hypothetical protein MUO19_00075 [Dehalococcoidales bacterium]|nr:hypothetical protein [Dehalococcoidales bacterium]